MFPIPSPCFIISPVINLDGEGWLVLRCFAYTIESRLRTKQKPIQARPSIFDLPRSFERMIAARPVRRPFKRIHPIEVRQEAIQGADRFGGADLHQPSMPFHPWLSSETLRLFLP